MGSAPVRRSLSQLALPVSVAAVYFIAARLGLLVTFAQRNVSIVWPASGIALASVLLFGYRVLPAVFLGAFFVNFATGLSATVSLGIATGNTLEALAGSFLLRRFLPSGISLDRFRDLVFFISLAACFSTMLSATVGVTSLCLGGSALWKEYGQLWFRWWFGDGVGELVLVPFILAWSGKVSPKREGVGNPVEFILVCLLMLTAAYILFFGVWFLKAATSYPLAHLTIPFLIWTAFRFGRREVSSQIVLLSVVTIAATSRGLGPFSGPNTRDSLLMLQTFIAISALTALLLAAVATERRQAQQQLLDGARKTKQTDLTGRIISHYRILGKLGGGGMGVVYEAEDFNLKRKVALKLLPVETADGAQALERFQREAQAASALNHRHICTVFEIGQQDGSPFIAMEFLKGQTLKHAIDGRAMKIGMIVELGAQIADALGAAHSKGIIHRDIKPANIFLTEQGEVKLLDFGLARRDTRGIGADTGQLTVSNQENLTKSGSAFGTVAYMSPEQIRGGDLDVRADLFSLGVVLYEMTTGMLPFPGESIGKMLEAIFTKEPVRPVRLNPGVPPGLEEIISRALQKDPKLRYQHASDVKADLQGLQVDCHSTR